MPHITNDFNDNSQHQLWCILTKLPSRSNWHSSPKGNESIHSGNSKQISPRTESLRDDSRGEWRDWVAGCFQRPIFVPKSDAFLTPLGSNSSPCKAPSSQIPSYPFEFGSEIVSWASEKKPTKSWSGGRALEAGEIWDINGDGIWDQVSGG